MTNLTPIKEAFRLSQDDFNRFAHLSGDHNPIHVDPDFSARTRFGATVSHGMLLFTVLRGCLLRTFPTYTLATQELVFPAPAFADEALTLRIDVTRAASSSALILNTQVLKNDGTACLQGQCYLEPNTGTAS
ncbi:MaoC/PaaZ C-terminal domain-containing protein [Marinobacter sp. X15-166B]|uniref:MaoC/PaaZ C-terminal domain-containing protein n=1 Tax=Marinobacter sp. X15-166B TaxID=1897620 RepID=UPI00085C58D3|nr:MaoC/PaaZ C-terminal domain-containing protein [Marinobacter sp. X15-166B]OEY66269.1 hypothetical protein BG841_07235 [Marinobacter sp. X15-166B]